MHIHIALYRWKHDATEKMIKQALSVTESLVGRVAGIIEITTAENASKYSEGYSHIIIVKGQDQAAIDAYFTLLNHGKVGRQLDAIEHQSIGVDFVVK